MDDPTSQAGSSNVVKAGECEGVIEGGDVSSSPPKSFEVHDHKEKHRGALTNKLFYAFAALIAAHYICTLLLIWKGKAESKMLDTLFTSTLPVLTGFLGSAITFYFKDR